MLIALHMHEISATIRALWCGGRRWHRRWKRRRQDRRAKLHASPSWRAWIAQPRSGVKKQIFDVALAAWLGQRPGLCIFEETCGTALAMEHNGDLYACDHFVEPMNRLGYLHYQAQRPQA